jgi:hypothetical protein
VKGKVNEQLETSNSFRMQNSAEIDDICTTVSSQFEMCSHHFLITILSFEVEKTFPIVRKYEKQWPVRDMIKLYLKYTSELSRKGDLSKKNGKVGGGAIRH